MLKPVALIYKNLAKLTGVAASAAVAGYPASNVLTTDKSETYRAPGKTVTLSGSSATQLTATCVYLLGNFSPSLAVRVLLWSDVAKTDLVRDTGPVMACREPSVEIADWSPADAASAYAHGGGAKPRVWFDPTPYRAWEIRLDDTAGNLQGFLEVVHLVLGAHWAPTYDVEGGVELTLHDTAVKMRSAAGSLRYRKGVRYRTMPFPLTALTTSDRREVLKIFRYCGTTGPILVALHPGHEDPELERDTMIYGCLDEVAALVLEGPDSCATSIAIQEF